eukprot:1390967-Amphidinium_carterae.2
MRVALCCGGTAELPINDLQDSLSIRPVNLCIGCRNCSNLHSSRAVGTDPSESRVEDKTSAWVGEQTCPKTFMMLARYERG